MKILITGGAGFIGSNLARTLSASTAISEIRILDDLSTGFRSNLTGVDVTLTEGSVLDAATVARVVAGVDSVVHLAAMASVPRSIDNPLACHEANATGTLLLLEAVRAAGVPHVVVASSSAVYGTNPKLPKSEEDWTRPISPYAVSKEATEGYALAYQMSYGIKTLAFRFFNVYGPNQAPDHDYAAVIPQFLDKALGGRTVEVHGDGGQSRDFTYVDTLCQVIGQAVLRQVSSPDPVNLAYGSNTTMLELLDEIEAVLGCPVARRHTATRAGDVRASQADNSRVTTLFPDIDPVPLRDGLAATAEWFRGAYAEQRSA